MATGRNENRWQDRGDWGKGKASREWVESRQPDPEAWERAAKGSTRWQLRAGVADLHDVYGIVDDVGLETRRAALEIMLDNLDNRAYG